MRTRIDLVSEPSQWLICGLIILVATLGKFGGTLLAARLTGLRWRDAAILGTDGLSKEELNRLRKLAYTKLYFSSRWWRQNLRTALATRDDFELAFRYGLRVLSNYFIHGMHGTH